MTPETFARLRTLFDQAMAEPVERRQAFIDAHVTAGDPLRGELQAMVDAGDDTAFLAHAAVSGIPLDVLRGAAPVPDLRVNNYKVIREIARGGMGVVYLAVRNDDVFHKVVALKVIGGPDSERADLLARFRQERQILAGLDHPNVARILDGGNTEDGRPFYVMEYVAGSPIDQYCARNRTDGAGRVRMMTDVCQAVEYLHGHAITHRDIKPSNILVATDGRVKLVDFGIAKVDTIDGLLAGPSSPGQPTMIMTPGYASPEQLHGLPSGKAGDIYSLGVVLYQLIAGKLPFAGAGGEPNVNAQLSGRDPDPPSRAGGLAVSADVDRVVLKALARDLSRRYESVRDFAEDLRRCLDGRPITARAVTPTYRLQKLVARNRLSVALAAALVLMTGAGVWMAVSLRIERVRLEAKEDELGRFVQMFDSRVARWPEPTIKTEEKVADVQVANQVMASETVRTLSQQAPDPERVKRLIDDLRSVIDRAEQLSAGLAPLRKEIAVAYRQIGDFQATATKPRVKDTGQAKVSYGRAATVVNSIRASEPEWARQEMSELGGRLEAIGAPPVQLAEVEPVVAEPPPPTPEPPPPPKPMAPRATVAERPRATAGAPVDPELEADVRLRFRQVSSNTEVAHRNLESLRTSLAASGQTVRPDILTTMTRVDDLLEDARTAIERADFSDADERLTRAAYELRRLLGSVGGG